MADASAIIQGKGTVKKNLQWFILGLICIVVVFAIFAQDASSKKRKAEKEKDDKPLTYTEVNSDSIKGALDKQKTVDIPNERPSMPEAVTDGVGKDPRETAALTESEKSAVEDARRESQGSNAAILSINGENSGSLQQAANDFLGASTNKNEVAHVNEDDLRRAAAPPIIPADNVQPPAGPLTQAEKDIAWQSAQSKLKPTTQITEDTPNSPYTIFQGQSIPAVLSSKVNSQLPGDVTGVISQDVYDGVTGSHLIIPKGSTVYGTYNNSVTQGQNRVQLSFSRLVLPGGRSVSLLGQAGTDKEGQFGIEGDVNNHYFQRLGIPLFTAILGALADNNNKGVDARLKLTTCAR